MMSVWQELHKGKEADLSAVVQTVLDAGEVPEELVQAVTSADEDCRYNCYQVLVEVAAPRRARWPRRSWRSTGGEMFKGLLLKESLKDESILDLVRVTKTEVWDVSEAAEDWQLQEWTAISFEGESDQADAVAEAMGQVMKPEWYANFSTETHVYVIFEDRVFKYVKGDVDERAKAQAYAISVGIPENQVDWGE